MITATRKQSLKYSEQGFGLTKAFEGLRLEAYRDCAGVWTVGYGHTGAAVGSGMTISLEEAEALLRSDLQLAIRCVNHALEVPVSQNQFDALVDFCFNGGRGNFLQSSLLRKLNQGDVAGAAAQFALWIHAGNKVVPGLIRRRKAEAELFEKSDPAQP